MDDHIEQTSKRDGQTQAILENNNLDESAPPVPNIPSEKEVTPQNTDETQESGPSSLEDLKPGMQLQGRVRNVVSFGAFIDIGVGRDGLAHISTLKRAGKDKDLKAGDEIEVVVRRVDLDNNRISLTVPRAERATKIALQELEPGSVVTGRVMRLVDFGAFVDIGASTDALLHISQFGGGHIRHPSDVLNVGDEIQVRILEVDPDRRRISLTMRDLEQEDEEPGPQRNAPEPQQSGEPTAFELAFQQALAERRRRGRRQ